MISSQSDALSKIRSENNAITSHALKKRLAKQKKTNLSRVTFTDDPGYMTPESVSLNEQPIDISETDQTGTSIRVAEWKPKTETTYETLVLT